MKHIAEDISVENRLEFLEENRRFIQNSLESALRLGDFQEKITTNSNAEQVFEETEKPNVFPAETSTSASLAM